MNALTLNWDWEPWAILSFILLQGAMIWHLLRKEQFSLPFKKKKKKQAAKAGRDSVQAGRDVIQHFVPPARELTPYEAHLQQTINNCYDQLREKDVQLKAKRKLYERLMDKLEAKEAEIDGLWNELLTLKDEQRRFPVLNLTPRKEAENKDVA